MWEKFFAKRDNNKSQNQQISNDNSVFVHLRTRQLEHDLDVCIRYSSFSPLILL